MTTFFRVTQKLLGRFQWNFQGLFTSQQLLCNKVGAKSAHYSQSYDCLNLESLFSVIFGRYIKIPFLNKRTAFRIENILLLTFILGYYLCKSNNLISQVFMLLWKVEILPIFADFRPFWTHIQLSQFWRKTYETFRIFRL